MNPKHAPPHHDGVEETHATSTPPGDDQENLQPNHAIVLGDFDHAGTLLANQQLCDILHQGDLGSYEDPSSILKEVREEEQKQTHGDLDQTDHEANSTDVVDAWINLPTDMCHLILNRLDAFEILRFPLGRGPWADAYVQRRRLQPGAPTLLTSPCDDGWEIPDDYKRGLFFVHDIASRDAFLVEVDGLRYGNWTGGKDEWLVITFITSSCVRLLNPITRRCTALPNYSRVSSSDRIKLCRTPAEAGGHFAIAISFCGLCYTRAGWAHWITLENPKCSLSYSDAITPGGKLIAICRNGDLWSWDLDQGGKNPTLLLSSSSIDTKGWKMFDSILAPSLTNDKILIVSPYGEDVPVRWTHRGPCHSKHWNVDGALLHELDIDAQSIEEVHDIGDRALFLGPNYPFYVPVSAPLGDLKKNYLYIAALSDHDVVAIDLSAGDLSCNVSLIDYSGPHNPYQKQMWFRPALP